MKTWNRNGIRGIRTLGFTLIEVVVGVAVIGVLGLIGTSIVTGLREKASLVRLESDTDLLNRAVKSYLASNGDLSSCQSLDAVVRKLKTAANQQSAERFLGFTGAFIDPRLQPVPQSEKEAATKQPRITWNAEGFRFEIKTEGAAGVKAFEIAEDVDFIPEATDQRDATMNLASEDNWIWDYTDRTAPLPLGSTPMAVASVPPGPAPSPIIAPAPKQTLQSPQLSIPTTTRSIDEFNLSLLLSNPNPANSSKIVYSIDYGNWVDYTGVGISVEPGTIVKAQALPIDSSEWYPSKVAQGSYSATPETLETPQIGSTASLFSDSTPSVDISITNPNSTDFSKVVYRLNGGSWQDYASPFTLNRSDYSSGVTIEARATPTKPYYIQSSPTSLLIEGSPEQLLAPLIAFSADAFSNDSKNPVTSITVQLDNPNPIGSSILSFQILPAPGGPGTATSYQDYTGPFTVKQAFYPSGFGIRAVAKPLTSDYEESEPALRYATTYEGVFGGHLDLDTSNFLSALNSGNIVNHTHDFTGKYNLSSVDFFSLVESKHVEVDEAIVSTSQRFKILVSNADLSPGMRIVINKTKDGQSHRISVPVTVYDDMAVADLPVFTLDGSGGTFRLTGLEAKFDQDVILNAGALPTNPGESIKNVPGKGGEWRNGALTFQAVSVNADGSDGFGTDLSLSNGGNQGVATSGLLWEANLYWHWDGKSYDDPQNAYKPGNPKSIEGHTNSDGLGNK